MAGKGRRSWLGFGILSHALSPGEAFRGDSYPLCQGVHNCFIDVPFLILPIRLNLTPWTEYLDIDSTRSTGTSYMLVATLSPGKDLLWSDPPCTYFMLYPLSILDFMLRLGACMALDWLMLTDSWEGTRIQIGAIEQWGPFIYHLCSFCYYSDDHLCIFCKFCARWTTFA